MDLKLRVARGPAITRVIKIHNPRTIIGRGKGCDVRIPSAAVSRRHCVLTLEEERVAVEDLDSVNGTLVNGRRLSGRQRLRPGDKLQIGPLTFTIDFKPAPAKKAPREEEDGLIPLAALEDEDELVPLAEEEEAPEVLAVADEEDDEEEVVLEADDSGEINLPVDEDFHDLLSELEE